MISFFVDLAGVLFGPTYSHEQENSRARLLVASVHKLARYGRMTDGSRGNLFSVVTLQIGEKALSQDLHVASLLRVSACDASFYVHARCFVSHCRTTVIQTIKNKDNNIIEIEYGNVIGMHI